MNPLDEKSQDTIAAIATPPGNGGVGIIRISGPQASSIASQLLGRVLRPRYAHFATFNDAKGGQIDSGLVLWFPAPASYTGEDCLELQGHGGAIVLDMLLRRVVELGARLARPGEFTERAFLNNKIDLAQAEAVADLIESSTEQSVRSANLSLQGVFSNQINDLLEQLIEVRMFVESAIDFTDEDIDFLSDGAIEKRIKQILKQLLEIKKTAGQGRLLRDGMTVVLAGKPNAGKSSLLNSLAGHEAAIVTDIAGTTRDVLKERIQIDGMPLHISDTAGLRESTNLIEKEGIKRAQEEMQKADRILLLIDSNKENFDEQLLQNIPKEIGLTKIYNKIDLQQKEPTIKQNNSVTEIFMSVKTGAGFDLLIDHLKQCIGYEAETDSVFIARRRHIEALNKAQTSTKNALEQLQQNQAGELVAEDLKQAQHYLSEITGAFTSDDLLGRIFSSFCIGK